MADLTINNCILTNGAAIEGSAKIGGGGGLVAGGGVYIDRGNTLTLSNTKIIHCKATDGSVVQLMELVLVSRIKTKMDRG